MKYLKLFENIEEILEMEFSNSLDLLDKYNELLTDKDIIKIFNFIKNIDNNLSIKKKYDKLAMYHIKNINEEIFTFFLYDDYFYVCFYPRDGWYLRNRFKKRYFFKCDQLSSFLKLLKQKL